MELKKLTRGHPDIISAQKLNEEAFPDNEKVNIDDFFNSGGKAKTEVIGIYSDNIFSGFIVLRILDNIAYIAYFAVVKELRCNGIGSKALVHLKEYCNGKQIITDFESVHEKSENSGQRIRRRNFYIRNGFYETGMYMYYMDTEFEIFCSESNFDKKGFENMIADIHSFVPEFDPHMYCKAP